MPPFLRGQGQGWVTAEYGMLPRATHTRGDREAARGKQSGRTQEIQRLIGRSLRAVTDLKAMGEMTVTHRLRRADRRWRHALRVHHRRLGGAAPGLRALPADEHHDAQPADATRSPRSPAACGRARRCSTSTMPRTARRMPMRNFVLTGAGGIVEVQGTAEGAPFSEARADGAAGPARAAARRSCSRSSARRSGCDGASRARPRRAASSSPPTMPASCAKSRRCWRPYGIEMVSRRRARPAGAGGDRGQLPRQCRHQGAGRRARLRPAGAGR